LAQPVLLVKIPKVKGDFRRLGVPTVSDRVAQMVIQNRIEPILEKVFHEDSFAYRPNKSAISAVTLCRSRCFKHEWLIEIDIKRFFDNINHDILIKMLEKYTSESFTLLYSKRFLMSSGITTEGIEIARDLGATQGGACSPILANLYLHEAYDEWMQQKYSEIKFERFADDIVYIVAQRNRHILLKIKLRKD
jgi:RNA-directed DNA polymerase